jgi:hypothetical protein
MATVPLRNDEQIIAEIRQRAASFFWQWMLVVMLLLGAALGMFWFFRQGGIGVTAFIILVTLGGWHLVATIIRMKGTVLIVTTHRLVDCVKDELFGKTISEVDLSQIEEVIVRQRGFWRTVWKYGTVEIRIRDSKVRLVVDNISRPLGVQRLINELRRHTQKPQGDAMPTTSFEHLLKTIHTLDHEKLKALQMMIEEKMKQLRKK